MSTIERLVVASEQLDSLEHLVSAVANIGAAAYDLSIQLDDFARAEKDPARQATFMRLQHSLRDFALGTRHAIADAPTELLKGAIRRERTETPAKQAESARGSPL